MTLGAISVASHLQRQAGFEPMLLRARLNSSLEKKRLRDSVVKQMQFIREIFGKFVVRRLSPVDQPSNNTGLLHHRRVVHRGDGVFETLKVMRGKPGPSNPVVLGADVVGFVCALVLSRFAFNVPLPLGRLALVTIAASAPRRRVTCCSGSTRW